MPGFFLRNSSLATTNEDKFPLVPPATKQPPALSGSPTRSAIHRMTWFSAQTAPLASCQETPQRDPAETTKSKIIEALVGAAGIKAKFRGESTEIMLCSIVFLY